MPSLATHCQDCRRTLGQEFEDVHRWLDELFAVHGPTHRRFRHHRAGIEEVHRRWGERAAEAARLHLVADLEEQGWSEGRDRLPQDQADYVGMGWV